MREFAPGMTVHLQGYNGQSPDPTIECVDGDRIRIFSPISCPSTPRLLLLLSDMDGVGGMSQLQIGRARPSSTNTP